MYLPKLGLDEWLTRRTAWLTSIGFWTVGIGLAIASAVHEEHAAFAAPSLTSSSPCLVSADVETTAASRSDTSTESPSEDSQAAQTTDETQAAGALFMPEDVIVARPETPAGVTEMQTP